MDLNIDFNAKDSHGWTQILILMLKTVMDGLYLWKLAFMDTKVVKFKNIFLFICRWKKMPPISLREFELVIKMQVKTGSFPRPPMRYFVQCLADYPYWAQLPSTKWQWLKSNEGWPLLNASMLHSLVEFSAGKKASSNVQSALRCQLENIESAWKNFFTIILLAAPQNSKPLIELHSKITVDLNTQRMQQW